MPHQRKILLMATSTVLLILVSMTIGIGILWQRVLHFHAVQLGKQIRSTLVREVSEGNYFGVSATIDRLRMAGIYSRIAVVDTGTAPTQWLYVSDEAFRDSLARGTLISSCFINTSDRNVQVGNELFYSVPLRESSKPNSGVCALVSSELSDELLNLRSLVIFIFIVIAVIAIAGLTYLMIRLNRQQLEFQKIESQKQLEKAEALGNLASQVSHDIRSPLTALNMLVSSISNLPEEQRLILRGAAQRINDIANQLLANSRSQPPSPSTCKSPNPHGTPQAEKILVPTVVDLLVSEKRVQFRDKSSVRIEYDSGGVYDAFVDFPQQELGRSLSNLINNSIEALPVEGGEVKVSLRSYSSQIQIIVSDTGKGIPKHLLNKVGTKGLSFGKVGTQSGSGLGLYHAITILERHNGRLEVTSKQGVGTIISATLPRTKAPEWFLPELKFSHSLTIAIVDDDTIIHSVWKTRFADLTQAYRQLRVLSFSTGISFHEWLISNDRSGLNLLVLMDYEFLDQKENGLELIERLSLANKSVLVTSRFDDPQIQRRVNLRQIRMIPKSMAPSIPMSLT